MPIDPNSIAVGLCYKTTSEQVRKVISLEGDDIGYAFRGSKNRKDWEKSGHRRTTTRNKFVLEVEREVKCHWDEDYPELARVPNAAPPVNEGQ